MLGMCWALRKQESSWSNISYRERGWLDVLDTLLCYKVLLKSRKALKSFSILDTAIPHQAFFQAWFILGLGISQSQEGHTKLFIPCWIHFTTSTRLQPPAMGHPCPHSPTSREHRLTGLLPFHLIHTQLLSFWRPLASTAVRNSPGKCVLKHPKHSLNLSQSCTKHNPLSPPPFLGCSDPNQHLAREKQERKSSSGVERGRDRAQKARQTDKGKASDWHSRSASEHSNSSCPRAHWEMGYPGQQQQLRDACAFLTQMLPGKGSRDSNRLPPRELLLLLVAVGLFAGNCISPRAPADTAVGEQLLCIHRHRTKWAKLLQWRPRLCFGKQKNKPPWSGITSKLIKLHPQQGLLLQFQQEEMKNHSLQPA